MKVAGLEESMAGLINLEKAKAQGGTAFKDMLIGLVQERLDNLTEDLEEMNTKKAGTLPARHLLPQAAEFEGRPR